MKIPKLLKRLNVAPLLRGSRWRSQNHVAGEEVVTLNQPKSPIAVIEGMYNRWMACAVCVALRFWPTVGQLINVDFNNASLSPLLSSGPQTTSMKESSIKSKPKFGAFKVSIIAFTPSIASRNFVDLIH